MDSQYCQWVLLALSPVRLSRTPLSQDWMITTFFLFFCMKLALSSLEWWSPFFEENFQYEVYWAFFDTKSTFLNSPLNLYIRFFWKSSHQNKTMGVLHSFSIKNIFYGKMDWRLFYFDEAECTWRQAFKVSKSNGFEFLRRILMIPKKWGKWVIFGLKVNTFEPFLNLLASFFWNRAWWQVFKSV